MLNPPGNVGRRCGFRQSQVARSPNGGSGGLAATDERRHARSKEPMSKPVTVADLFDLLDPSGAGAFLWCPRCGGEFSATRGDYFWKPAGEAFTCRGPVGLRHRKGNLQLVRR